MPKDTFFNLPEEKRNKIIDSAMIQFSNKHYNKVTIDSIVDEAKIPKGSFYQYFTNKNDLYTYMFNRLGDTKSEMLSTVKNYVDTMSFSDCIIKMLEISVQYETDDDNISQLNNKFLNECPQEIKNEILKNEIPKSYRLLEQIIKEYVLKGELRKDLDIKNASYIITSCALNIEHYELTNGDISETLRTVINVVVDGFKN